jgi:hypothetical protein
MSGDRRTPRKVNPMGLFSNKRKRAENLFHTGAKGAGTVISVRDTGMTVNNNPRVKMTFRVEPLDGGPAFDVTKTKTVSRVEIPRQGERYPVWYDPQDVDNWAYATVADDTGRATMRQLFGEVAETFAGMAAAAPAGPSAAEALSQLADLHARGVLTADEFAAGKAKLLG